MLSREGHSKVYPGWTGRTPALLNNFGGCCVSTNSSLTNLWSSFKDQVKRCLRSSSESCKPGSTHHLSQPLFSRLGAQRQTHLLRQRRWSTKERPLPIESASDRMQILFNLVSGERLDDHPGSIAFQAFADVRGGSYRIAHIVQTIKKCYEVVVLSRITFRLGYFELDSIGDTGILGTLFRGSNGHAVIVKAEKLGIGKGLRHQDGGGAKAAPHIRHRRPSGQLFCDSCHRRNPRADKVRGIPRPEKTLSADEQVRIMLVPTHPLAGFEPLGNLFLCLCCRERDLKRAGEKGRTVFIRQGECLFLSQIEPAGQGVVGYISSSRLIAKPFACVTLCGPGMFRQLRGGLRAPIGKRFVQAKSIPDPDQGGMKGGAEVHHRSA